MAVILAEDSAQTGRTSAIDRPAAAEAGLPLRSRGFWGVVTFVLFAELFGAVGPGALPMPRRFPPTMAPWSVGILASVATIAGAAVYAPLSRWVTQRSLLRWSLVLQGLGLVILLEASSRSPVAFAIRIFTGGLVATALVHLALRAAPPGREALGFFLLAGLPRLVMTTASNAVVAPAVLSAGLSPSALALFAGIALVLMAVAVSVLPRSLLAGKDGNPLQSD